MSKSANKAILLGNVGKDPEIRSTNGRTIVASFSLATASRVCGSSIPRYIEGSPTKTDMQAKSEKKRDGSTKFEQFT